MRGVVSLLVLIALGASAQNGVERLRDPVTGRDIVRYASRNHQTHHYYFVSPWSPSADRLLFFSFDDEVDKLTATGRYPGALWVMNRNGGERRKIVDSLMGHYHVGVNQLWGPKGEYVYFRDPDRACMARVRADGGAVECVDTPVPCGRLSPDGTQLSCGTGQEQGVFDLATKGYRRLVTLAEALAVTPNRAEIVGEPSQLQNTRFSPTGDRLMIVHRTRETFPRLVEIFVYDFAKRRLRWLADDLHHPTWRPDGKAILFVRHDPRTNRQWLVEVDVESGEDRIAFDAAHVPAGHPSYHPRKPHLVVTDCYGGEMGNGLALINLEARTMEQLVTIPLGSRPEPIADERFNFRNWGIWFPPRKYLNEPRPVWNVDGSRLLYTSEESGRMNLYVVDTSDL